MRPSSSRSDPANDPASADQTGAASAGLFGALLDRGAVAIASDEAWLAAMLEVEAALAHAQARVGMAHLEDAAAVERACRSLRLDADAIGREAAATGNPVIPLVRALRGAVDGPAADLVHRGATSQDVMDTATVLLARQSLVAIDRQLAAAADAAARLAAVHRDTILPARTLLQQALPTTFGLKAAGWMTGLDDAQAGLRAVRDRLALQLGGGAGTLAAYGADGPRLVDAMAAELGLAAPVLPWHTQRNRMAELAAVLGVAAGAIAKPARDVVLLAQTEIAEVRERGAGRGSSSALPQKRNPIAAVSALAAARQAPGLVANVLAQMEQEHERAAGAWHAEWAPMRNLVAAVASAAAWLADSLAQLEVNEGAMRANMARGDGLLLAERIVASLAPLVGRGAAEELVQSVARAASDERQKGDERSFSTTLRRRLAGDPRLEAIDLDELLDPLGYLGAAGELVDRALAAHESVRGNR